MWLLKIFENLIYSFPIILKRIAVLRYPGYLKLLKTLPAMNRSMKIYSKPYQVFQTMTIILKGGSAWIQVT